MSAATECMCCSEIDQVHEKMEENDSKVSCITEHKGFLTVRLNRWVLRTAYYSYRSRYGDTEEKTLHE